MQSFFHNNENEERQLTELADKIYQTILKDFHSRQPFFSIPPNFRDSLKDVVYKLVKIASQQNRLLLQFPAVLAYFVYNFLKNIDLDRLDYINEKLGEIQRLIQRKNWQGLSFNSIKQLLQQELQEKKFRQNRPSKGETRGEQGEKRKGERQEEGEEGEESESEGSEGQQGQESGEESQKGSGQENGESQGGQEGEESGGESGSQESGEGQELGGEGGQQGENEGQNSEGQGNQNGEEGEGGEGGQESGGSEGEGQESEREGNQEEETETRGSGEESEGGGQGSESGEGEWEGGEEGGEQGGGQSEGGEGQEVEDAFEDLEKSINEQMMILDELEESLQKSLSALSIGRGSGRGILNEVNPRILQLLERANRILALANQVDLQYANNRGVKDQGGVMKGITTGNNLKHMFKSQMILPDEIFLGRYVNRALLQRAVENEGVGDFYFIIDKSGSMGSEMPNGYTAFENVSAVALASSMEAEKNGRKVFVQYFDESTTEPIDVNDVLELARTEPGGGTDMMVALRSFIDYYNNYPGLKDVKQVFILSDFGTSYDEETLEDFKNFARNNGLVVTCMHVYDFDSIPPEMQYIIDEICDEYYKFNDYDASELFSVVYSKV